MPKNSDEELNEKVFNLAKWIIEFEFMNPRNRNMSTHQLMTTYSNKIMELIRQAETRAQIGMVEYYDQNPTNESMDWKGLFKDNLAALKYELEQQLHLNEEEK